MQHDFTCAPEALHSMSVSIPTLIVSIHLDISQSPKATANPIRSVLLALDAGRCPSPKHESPGCSQLLVRSICPGRHLADASLWIAMASILATMLEERLLLNSASLAVSQGQPRVRLLYIFYIWLRFQANRIRISVAFFLGMKWLDRW